MAERVAVVGAGIVGVAHAWREAARGRSVTLFERDPRAQGASVRNFGMVWPIGQAPELIDTALSSRSLWREYLDATGAWGHELGSLHVANQQDELRVLEEFAAAGPDLGYDCRMLSAAEARRASPALDHEATLGALASPTEIGVDPREAIAVAPAWLAERYGVELEFGATVVDIDMPRLQTADGRRWEYDRVVVASGADFATLYPDAFATASLLKCKLQMMRTGAQPEGWRLGPMLASGLTLRHYPTFSICPGLAALKERIASETPELDKHGIHVMAAQNGLGEVVLGDSHEYGGSAEPFDNEEITRLMLRELRKIFALPDWDLAARWHGVYAWRSAGGVEFEHKPAPGVTIALVNGGCGMTMAFGLAERRVARGAPVGPKQPAFLKSRTTEAIHD
ncbi:D-amino acid dehydrogenase small subunit [Pseudobythopirellula maris]|uniref:D-amino acid dehydrogenase small subunit n=1 Tax=Pseudobythopirellula maris TaxID=2527991 RepID=A0A5C5ZKP2_9BACT|nr:TIGR03364 family FAD-dependent oxidoreductase [Pseudobythopirellula maris]TWT87617.1 D-amino acid dehydrogenase small subunit [Pseudobythopirellula maris]